MPQVVVIGSALVEITPETPGQPLAQADRLVPLPSGAAANFAISLARLGVSVGFITRVGDDELGEWLLANLAAQGIEPELMGKVAGQLTPCSFCWADLSGQKRFYFYRFAGYSDPMATFKAAEISDQTLKTARIFDFTEAGIRGEPLRSQTLELAARARQTGAQVCYAANYRADSWHAPHEEVLEVERAAMRLANIALMNSQEATLFFGTQDIWEAAAQARALGPQIVAVTCGEQGALVAAETAVWIPATQVEVRYDVGAGDAFHAGFVAGLLGGMAPAQAGRFASAAAALKISRTATTPPPTREEVLQAFETGQT